MELIRFFFYIFKSFLLPNSHFHYMHSPIIVFFLFVLYFYFVFLVFSFFLLLLFVLDRFFSSSSPLLFLFILCSCLRAFLSFLVSVFLSFLVSVFTLCRNLSECCCLYPRLPPYRPTISLQG